MSGQKAKQSRHQGGGRGKRKIVIGVLVIIIAVLLGVIVYLLRPKEEGKRDVIVTPDNVDEVISQMKEEEKTPAGSYEVSMSTDWTFPDGKSKSPNAFVENRIANTNTVYFTITVDGEEEEIYHSPYLEVGSQLEDIQLDKELAKGTYNTVITYHLVDEEFNELSHLSMNLTITIEN